MANLLKLGFDKISDLVDKLAQAGFTVKMADEVRKNPKLAEAIVNALKAHSAFTLVHGLFVKPESQITRVRAWNHEFGWDIPDEAFATAEKSVPAWPEQQLVAVVLVPYLGDKSNYLGDKSNKNGTVTCGIERTFHELWACAKSEQDANWRWDGYDKAGSDGLRLLKGLEHKIGLRWEVIDLGCQRNTKPCDVRSSKPSPNAGILAAAALHPQWVKRMDGDKVPYVWLPGYKVRIPGEEPWADVPYLYFGRDDREIKLYSGWSGHYFGSGWAVPSFVRE